MTGTKRLHGTTVAAGLGGADEMQVQDPVCGKSIQLEEVVAAEDDGDWAYFFCSAACHDRFRATPARYAGERPAPGGNLKASADDGAGGWR